MLRSLVHDGASKRSTKGVDRNPEGAGRGVCARHEEALKWRDGCHVERQRSVRLHVA